MEETESSTGDTQHSRWTALQLCAVAAWLCAMLTGHHQGGAEGQLLVLVEEVVRVAAGRVLTDRHVWC